MYEYIVKPGDTLPGIADYYGVSVESILAANKNISQEDIPAGTAIVIPVSVFRKLLRGIFPLVL